MSDAVEGAERVALTFDSSRGRGVVAVTVLGSGIAALDATVVGIALPVIGKSFHAGVAELQWVVNGYLLTLAGLLLLGGVLGDRFGRRRIYLTGVVWFALASLACSVAPNAGALIAARVVQGVGGALLVPGSLAILQASFVTSDRGRAIGAWSGFGGIGTAIGPFVGGYLIQAVSWRLIFLINLPLAALVIMLGRKLVPESRDRNAPERVPVPSALLVTLGLVGLTYGLIEGPAIGWSSSAVAIALVGGAACLVAFGIGETRRAVPLVPIEVFASRQFLAANVVTFLVYGALGASFFLLPVELEQVARYSPLEAGASLLPVTALMLVFSPRFGALASRIGPRLPMALGPALAACGLALLVRIGTSGTFVTEVLPGIALFGFGLSITVAPLTATVLAAAPGEHAGAASAINNDVARAASLIAIAVIPAAAGVSGLSYLHPVRFNGEFHTAVLLCAALCASGGLVATSVIRNGGPVAPVETPPARAVGAAGDFSGG